MRTDSYLRSLAAIICLLSIAGCREGPADAQAPGATTPAPSSAAARQADTAIGGIPIGEIDSTWVEAKVREYAVIVSDSGRSFSADSLARQSYLEGDFNRDGVIDRAMVGSYRDRADTVGQFLLIISATGSGWRKAAVEHMTGSTGAPFLQRLASDTLLWSDCLECDATPVLLYWNGRRYEIRWRD
jgi:hypothetical protein